MSLFSNINSLAISGSTINVVSGNQTSTTVINVAGTSASAEGNFPGAQAVAAVAYTGPSRRPPMFSGTRALPRLNDMFTGREDILQQMTQYFDPSMPSILLRKQLIFVLYGLGGAGKTQIMMKFINEFFDQFSEVYYIDASSLETIQSSLEDIARSNSVGQSAEDALRSLAQEHKEWLLLLDNADDPSINLRQFFPPCRHGNIIITSRNKACRLHGPDSNCCVSGMKPDDAVELLFKHAMVERCDENRSICASITQEFGYLALAIAQAGAYIAQASCLSGYLDMYQEDRAELLRRHSVQTSDDYEWTVYTTWEMSLKKLSSTAAMFLRLCGFMHYEGISMTIFKRAASEDANTFYFPDGTGFLKEFKSANGRWSDIRFLDVVKELASYSLININAVGHVYSVHPLVHSWARDRMDPAESRDAETCMTQILALSITEDYSSEGFAFRRSLLPHADQACTGEIGARVASILRIIYAEGGRRREAEALDKLTLESFLEELGDDHPDTLTTMANLARTYDDQGRWSEAEALEVKVMEARKRLLGDEHPDTLLVMANLARTYGDQGRWTEAEALEVKVMEARKRLLGDEHPNTLLSMGNLASTYADQGRWTEAEALKVKVMEARKKLLGDEHPDTLLVMANLARTYSDQGRWTEAEALQVKVMEARKRLLGDEHPDTLLCIGNLARIYYDQGRWTEAEALEVKVVETRKRLLGDEHPSTLLSVANLATTYCNQGRWSDAEALEVKVMEARKRLLGDEHPDTLVSIGNLASTYFNQGHHEEAGAMMFSVLEARRRLLVEYHPHTQASLNQCEHFIKQTGGHGYSI